MSITTVNHDSIREQKANGVSGRFGHKENTPPGDALSAPPQPLHRIQERYDTLEEKMQVIQEELSDAVDDLRTDANFQRHLDVMSRFHRYSFQNQLLIAIQYPEATRVAGAKVWKGLGRHPRKGVRGISVIAPVVVRPKKRKSTERKDTDEEEKPRVVGFTSRTVFDVSQTDGEPLPVIAKELSEEPPDGYIEDIEAAILRHGYTVKYEKTGDASLGYTRPSEKVVVIDPDLSPGTRATTLAHELGHIACGHVDRLDEYHVGHGGSRGTMEVEAESFSYVLSRMNGMATNTKPASEYIGSWQQHDDVTVKAIGDTIQKAVKRAVENNDWRNADFDE